ncbi:MAG: PadR family transcriptional regulator [Candidatus Omnitrophica bacterium]|nr:PadR family transcriptional regulator [Candidatus Omnitrophota bacterium]
MIENELVLLGLLKESPKHGYEIKKKIKEILSLFAGLDFKSIYYPLRILEKKGLVVKRINKAGRRPQRFVYELTPKGKERFKQLLTKSFLDLRRPQFSLDLSLYFLNYVQPDIAKRRLRARMSVLGRLSRDLTQMLGSLKNKKDSSLARILEHNLQMVQAESGFLKHLVGSL